MRTGLDFNVKCLCSSELRAEYDHPGLVAVVGDYSVRADVPGPLGPGSRPAAAEPRRVQLLRLRVAPAHAGAQGDGGWHHLSAVRYAVQLRLG